MFVCIMSVCMYDSLEIFKKFSFPFERKPMAVNSLYIPIPISQILYMYFLKKKKIVECFFFNFILLKMIVINNHLRENCSI